MKADELIIALNNKCQKNNEEGRFVLQKNIEVNSSFKLYKTYSYKLWYVLKRKKIIILTAQITDKVITGQEEIINKQLNIIFLEKVLSLINSETWENLKSGIYGTI